MGRHAWVDIDLSAVGNNVRALSAHVAPARLCAVVKADGYGHGAVEVSRAVLDAGAEWLAVALPEEGRALREAGIEAPILLLSEPDPDSFAEVMEADLRPTLYTASGIEACARAVEAFGRSPCPAHLKVNTGMNRVGADPSDALEMAVAVRAQPSLSLEGVWTHCAVADEPGNPFTALQLERLEKVLAELGTAGVEIPLVHAANSAAAIAHPESRYDMVRCGISVYGIAPSPALDGILPLQPAMSVRAEVGFVKRVRVGEAVSYGLSHRFERDTSVATVPLGYADGVPRRLYECGGEVLVGGGRRSVVGAVTMDQFMVDVGGDPVRAGDEVVLMGSQGNEAITAQDWASWLGTIAYEVVCGFGPRLPRRYR
ncbi:MAG: Alanine racemase [Acidimicrobiales bacterium]|nr:Alanine racemase [Acidimicrobiales bacterium]